MPMWQLCHIWFSSLYSSCELSCLLWCQTRSRQCEVFRSSSVHALYHVLKTRDQEMNIGTHYSIFMIMQSKLLLFVVRVLLCGFMCICVKISRFVVEMNKTTGELHKSNLKSDRRICTIVLSFTCTSIKCPMSSVRYLAD